MREAIRVLTNYCRNTLDFSGIKKEYGYAALSLCVIDTIFSIGANYTSTRNTVARFAKNYAIPTVGELHAIPKQQDMSVTKFLNLYNAYPQDADQGMADDVFNNRQRTSTKKGILKAEAVRLFLGLLHTYKVEYLDDFVSKNLVNNENFECDYKKIPGQSSGISLNYFYILIGDKEKIKPDRRIISFIKQNSGFEPNIDQAIIIVTEICANLQKEYPLLSPRAFDNLIWQHQRSL